MTPTLKTEADVGRWTTVARLQLAQPFGKTWSNFLRTLLLLDLFSM
jgi:hypothetical protein